VPYKGSGPAMTDLIGGQVQSMIETTPSCQASSRPQAAPAGDHHARTGRPAAGRATAAQAG